MTFTQVSLLALGAVALSGCAQIMALQLGNEMSDLQDALEAAEATPPDEMPTSSRATYDGVAAIAANAGANAMALAGDATLDAVFAPGGGTLTGRVTDFVGADIDPDEFDPLEDELGDFITGLDTGTGQLDITGGTITGNSLTASIDGAVTLNGSTVDLTGTLDGGFLGENAELIEADASFSDATLTGTIDGAPLTGGVVYVAATSE